MTTLREQKLSFLLDHVGLPFEVALRHYLTRSPVPSICMNEGCTWVRDDDPDSRNGWCEECETPTCEALFVLAEFL